MAQPIRGILFDLGNTLLDFGRVDILSLFEAGARSAYDHLKTLGYKLPTFARYHRRQLWAIRRRALWSKLTGREFDAIDLIIRLAERIGCRLTREQAVALMVLGQAMESSAGDPTKAGTIRSEFFYDPFVAGDLAEHANLFYKIVKGLPHLNFYLLNTGGIGEGEHYRDIRLEFTIGILDSLFRGGFEDWKDSPTGFQTPAAIRVVDDIYLHPEKLYSFREFEEKQRELNRLRYKAVAELGEGLHADIRKVFNKV